MHPPCISALLVLARRPVAWLGVVGVTDAVTEHLQYRRNSCPFASRLQFYECPRRCHCQAQATSSKNTRTISSVQNSRHQEIWQMVIGGDGYLRPITCRLVIASSALTSLAVFSEPSFGFLHNKKPKQTSKTAGCVTIPIYWFSDLHNVNWLLSSCDDMAPNLATRLPS